MSMFSEQELLRESLRHRDSRSPGHTPLPSAGLWDRHRFGQHATGGGAMDPELGPLYFRPDRAQLREALRADRFSSFARPRTLKRRLREPLLYLRALSEGA